MIHTPPPVGTFLEVTGIDQQASMLCRIKSYHDHDGDNIAVCSIIFFLPETSVRCDDDTYINLYADRLGAAKTLTEEEVALLFLGFDHREL